MNVSLADDLKNFVDDRVDRFTYVIFYLVRSDHLEVLRVLHSSRDIPARLQGL